MDRSTRRARAHRARAHVAHVRAIRSAYSSADAWNVGPDDRPMTRQTIGYGRSRPRAARTDEQRSAWGVRPVISRRVALDDQVA